MKYILKKLIKNKIIHEKEFDEYNYALKILFLKLIHYFAIFTISIFLDIFTETIIFLYSYSIIRGYVGGIHANNPWFCLAISILFVICLKIVLNTNVNSIIVLIFMIIISYYWYINCNKSLCQMKFLMHLLFINVFSLIFYLLAQSIYLNSLFYGYVINIILFIIYRN